MMGTKPSSRPTTCTEVHSRPLARWKVASSTATPSSWPPSTGPRASSGPRYTWWASRTASCPSSTPPRPRHGTRSAGCSTWPSHGPPGSSTVRGRVRAPWGTAGRWNVSRRPGWPPSPAYRGQVPDGSPRGTPDGASRRSEPGSDADRGGTAPHLALEDLSDHRVDEDRRVIRRLLALPGVPVDQPVRGPIGQDLGDQDQVDAHPPVPVERSTPVVPPGEQLVVRVEAAEHVDQAPGLEIGEGVALGPADVGHPLELGRIPHVTVFGRHVEVAAHRHRPIG